MLCIADEIEHCLWWQAIKSEPSFGIFNDSMQAKCAIIGAGFTGVAIAKRLATLRPNWKIILLDEKRIGFETSGRNSGFVEGYDLAEGDILHAKIINDIAIYGFSILQDLVEKNHIECDWSGLGAINGAAGSYANLKLQRLHALLEQLNEPHEILDSNAINQITGSNHYYMGLQLPRIALVQPALLVYGLAVNLPDNVIIYENSLVTNIVQRNGIKLQINNATLQVDHLFIATNAFTPKLGFLNKVLCPLRLYISATRQLTTEEQQMINGSREWGIFPAYPTGSTVRRTRDQRLIVRNSFHYSFLGKYDKVCLEKIRNSHLHTLHTIFPKLNSIELEYTWSGLIARTRGERTYFGKLADNIYAIAGCNGLGIASGTALGTLLADFALKVDSKILSEIIQLQKPLSLPPKVLIKLGLILVNAYYKNRYRKEV